MILKKNQYIEENKILHVRENRVDGKHKSKYNQYTSRQGVSKEQDPLEREYILDFANDELFQI